MSDWLDTNYLSPPSSTAITITSSTVTNDTTWGQWVLTSPTSPQYYAVQTSAGTSQFVWDNWIQTSGYPPRRVQREEAEYLRSQRHLATERRERHETARNRAEELLLACLDEEQVAQLTTLDRFSVTAASGRVYWIQRGYAGNVRSEGRRYCIHGPDNLPHADQMLMQKLLLETNEEGFLDVANESIDYEPMVAAA